MKKTIPTMVLLLLGIVFGFVALPDTIHAGTFTIFGPKDYSPSFKKSVMAKDYFSVINPDTSYTLHIYNGGKNNQFPPVSRTTLWLNGIQVVKPKEFNQHVAHIEKPVKLSKKNKLASEIRGKPQSRITVEITGIDNDPPTITAILTPPPDAAGWNNTNVTVSFECSDMTSGIASCSDPVVVETEAAGQIVTGYATDMAGNTATTSVTVNLDKTPPIINYSQWMTNIEAIDRATLSALTLPGTHDSGAYWLDDIIAPTEDGDFIFKNACDKIIGPITTAIAVRVANKKGHDFGLTQHLNIYDQLKSGIRFFDISPT